MRKLLAAALSALALLAAPAAAPAESVVVTADRMVDVLTGRTVEEPVVVITDGRIAGDPLADVRELEHVDVVIKGGTIVGDRR
ncbi:MAG TPA: hypothetical protein VN231_07875 [Allosphingosinicella sp.]|nr:hypothetical protein [Allosphingosinicella sp.]